jgi:hypothetical protein
MLADLIYDSSPESGTSFEHKVDEEEAVKSAY